MPTKAKRGPSKRAKATVAKNKATKKEISKATKTKNSNAGLTGWASQYGKERAKGKVSSERGDEIWRETQKKAKDAAKKATTLKAKLKKAKQSPVKTKGQMGRKKK